MGDHSDHSDNKQIDLCDDLVEIILSYLPLKPLVKFKCVSKHWYKHCTELSLKKNLGLGGFYYPSSTVAKPIHYGHRTWAYSPCNLLSEYDNNDGLTNNVLDLDFFFNSHAEDKFSIIDSCNGILLIRSINSDKFYVCNPLTKRWVDIRNYDTNDSERTYGNPRLCFDPLVSPYFKVYFICIEIGYVEGKRKLLYRGVMVFSSEKNIWEMQRTVNPYPCIPLTENGFVNDLTELQSFLYVSDFRYFPLHGYAYIFIYGTIVGFNLEDLKAPVREITLPTIPDEASFARDDFDSWFATSNGMFNFVCSGCDIERWWVLEDVEKGDWTLKWGMNGDSTSSLYARYKFSIRDIVDRLFMFHPNKVDTFFVIYVKNDRTSFFLCDTSEAKFDRCGKDVEIAADIIGFRYFFYLSPTLACIRLGS